MLDLIHVVGARPNFPKLAPVFRAAARRGLRQKVVHTGQHYDDAMSGSLLRDLGLPAPDYNLDVGSGSHATQTARVLERFEPILTQTRPRWVVVYGDVNSTLAASIVAAKLQVRIAHVEAGLRSFDRTMPEEINRIVTDRLADLLLTPSRDAGEQLRAEGEPNDEIVFVGNVMIDSLFHTIESLDRSPVRRPSGDGTHVLVTLHRPSNVDIPDRLTALCAALSEIATERAVYFPLHPRTRQRIAEGGHDLGAVRLLDPISYSEMVDLERTAHAAITDSGGVQEETTALGIPCFTVRENTERPVTVTEGTNRLVSNLAELPALVRTPTRSTGVRRPEGWDGGAGERIVEALLAR
jgi:UDP-N-acetylglucosamine 2-epimerase (non-hydrolysing)